MNTFLILKKYIKDIFPLVDMELDKWMKAALSIPDSELSRQAICSIQKKGFHARGGSAFSLYPKCASENTVKLIIAYQTISDYLDNLCDRANVEDEDAFHQLHLAMSDALIIGGSLHDYYMYYPYKDDGGYLRELIETCRACLSKIPSYDAVLKYCLKFADMYSSMQSYKHIPCNLREKKLYGWASQNIDKYPMIKPNEFCAASGSTLGIFVLFAAGYNPNINEQSIKKIVSAYFPWICGFHILLDYFIDYYEDIKDNELNFIEYYKDENVTLSRMKLFMETSLQCANGLKYPVFHKTIVYGLVSMYLSDPKARSGKLYAMSKSIMDSNGVKLKLMYSLCLKLRKTLKI